MGTRACTLSRFAVLVVALAPACAHLTKLPVAEVPIDQFQATPVGSTEVAAAVPPVVAEPEPAVSAPVTSTTPRPGAKPAASVPAPIEPQDPAQDKIDAAKKLMATGKHADLLSARKLLVEDVGSGHGTPGEARMLRTVCNKLGDKPCVAKASTYIK